MKKLTLSEWAAIGEIIGTVAVVVSLLFVAYSINRNTDATYAGSEDIIFERHSELANHFLADPTLAEIMVKRRTGTHLNSVEEVRWEKYILNLLDIWSTAYNRHQRQLLANEQWQAWDVYFTDLFKNGGEAFTEKSWQAQKLGYPPEFWSHVNSKLFVQQE